MPKSRYGIFENLEDSDYFIVINNLEFYFSSESYRNKFTENLNTYIQSEKEKNSLKYGCNIIPTIIYMIFYYISIEKRGFRVYFQNEYGGKTRINKEIPFLCKTIE